LAILINLTNHKLLPEQEEAAQSELSVTKIVELATDSYLRCALSDTPANPRELRELASLVLHYLQNFSSESKVYIHLPAGSPAFMWALCRALYDKNYRSKHYASDEHHMPPRPTVTPVFSHTRRDVAEKCLPNGSVVKHSIFKFERFIVIPEQRVEEDKQQ